MKSLLIFTAVVEVATGLALLIIPSFTVSLLLGGALTEPSGILLGRIGGAALIALAIACWFSKNDLNTSIAILKALIVYNILAILLLAYAVAEHFTGIGLWPALLLHAALLVWCFQSLGSKP